MVSKRVPTTRYRDVSTGQFVPDFVGKRRPTRTIRDMMDGSASGSATHTVERDAGTGRFVPTGMADLYPASTSTERVRNS